MKIIRIITISVIALLSFACDEFGDMNTNPNQPVNVSPDLVLPRVQIEILAQQADFGFNDGMLITQYAAKRQFGNFDRYVWGTTGFWNDYYNNLKDARNLINLAEERSHDNYKGIALVLEAYMFATLTECYGDIPFTQAIQGNAEETNYLPVYDDQKIVYQGIIAKYDEALDLLGEGNGSVDGDLIYAGDISKWRKLANSLKFRTIMRLEKKWGETSGFASAAELQSIVDSGEWLGSTEDNGSLIFLTAAPNQFPPSIERIGGFNDRRMAAFADTLMFQTWNDPRVPELYRTTVEYNEGREDIPYRGMPNGLTDGSALSWGGGVQFVSRMGERYREEAENVNMIIMMYSEFAFLLAEAAEKGYISGVNSEDMYKSGVVADMERYGIIMTTEDEYFSREGITYAGSSEEKLSLIGHQKWAALMMNGIEAYFDWRRTGFPSISPAVQNENASGQFQIPLRFLYPESEVTLNADNYNAAVEGLNLGNSINSKMWILQ